MLPLSLRHRFSLLLHRAKALILPLIFFKITADVFELLLEMRLKVELLELWFGKKEHGNAKNLIKMLYISFESSRVFLSLNGRVDVNSLMHWWDIIRPQLF